MQNIQEPYIRRKLVNVATGARADDAASDAKAVRKTMYLHIWRTALLLLASVALVSDLFLRIEFEFWKVLVFVIAFIDKQIPV